MSPLRQCLSKAASAAAGAGWRGVEAVNCYTTLAAGKTTITGRIIPRCGGYSLKTALPRGTPTPSLPLRNSQFSTSTSYSHGHITPPKPGEGLKVTFIDKDGTPNTFLVNQGDNLLDIAQEYELDVEGACGGSAACSTCHVIVADQDMYDRMPEPDDDENDMLDLAFGLTETSRLGCQVKMTKDLDGLVVKLPSMTRNLQSSDFSKK
ncbi:ferredoxin [Terfezia boudieri ATCC MYA-4762]|uniref:Ferredoxin n=1 Tax=Terfezia boudieri ATCC MYA-4762 TaxID=1051890 RepID=A0A3N4LB44_9PEZI|nr:ferredoxin [Terfezia boudieri ATCC MYA-4762]